MPYIDSSGIHLEGVPDGIPAVYGASTTGGGGTYLCISKSTDKDSDLRTIYGFSYSSSSSGSGGFNIRMA